MYCTVDDMVEAFGMNEIKSLSYKDKLPSDPYAQINIEAVNKAISDSVAEINMYLDSRGFLPVTDVPVVLRRMCCDMARYYLYSRPDETNAAYRNYKTRIAQLKDVAAGRLSLGLTAAGNVTEPENVVMFNPGRNIWKNDGGIW